MKTKPNIAISDSGFIFDPTTGESFTLNQTGFEIFSMLKSGKNLEEITIFIVDKYDVDKTIFERFFYDFISMLKQSQLLSEDEKKN